MAAEPAEAGKQSDRLARMPGLVVVFIILALVLAGLWLWSPEILAALQRALLNADPAWLLLAMLVTAGHFFMEPLRWCFYLTGLDQHIAQLYRRLLSIFSVTALVTYLLPAKLGLPVRIALLRGNLGTPVMLATGLLAVDSLLAYAVWALVAAAGYLLLFGATSTLLLLLVAGLVLGLVLIRWLRPRLQALRARLHEGLQIVSARLLGGCAAVVLVDIAGYALRHYVILLALGIDLNILTVTAIVALSIFAGFISMLPMGLGVYDASMAVLLEQAGVPLETAILVPIINRVLNLAVSILLAVPAAWHLGINPWLLRTTGSSKIT